MQQFKGSLAYSGNERGVFVTTSDFTQGASEVAEGPGIPIVLVNGQNLVARMLEKGLGIRTIPVTKREIDEGFFENLTG
jgi:restriction system protein